MPAVSLRSDPIERFDGDVVGECSAPASGFVTHVALLESPGKLSQKTPVSVTHMGPPLNKGQLSVDVAGWAELTADERKKLAVWKQKRLDEDTPSSYVVSPAWQRIENKKNKRVRRWQYSCAGFVLAGYKFAVHVTLVEENGQLPEVDLKTLKKAYPHNDQLDDAHARTIVGLTGDGPWRIILAGYVIHALNRDSGLIRKEPYKPKPGDEIFI